MSQLDIYGNFISSEPAIPAQTLNFYHAILNGSGAPDNANGSNGDLYVDTSSGSVYSKSSGSWSIVTGGGGGGFNNLTGNGTPVGVKTPQYIGQYYTDLTAPYGLWFSTAININSWTELIGNV